MIWNYLMTGLRNLRRYTFYSLLNILGLAVGIGCALLAVLYVGYQFRFDQHHEKSDRIYRVIRKLQDVSGERYDLGTKPVAPHLRGKFPEVEAVTRMLVRRMWASHEDRGSDARVCVTDAEVFDIFTLPMVVGDPKTGLNDPHTAFLSQTLARRLFGDEDPIGKTVNIHYKWFKGDLHWPKLEREKEARKRRITRPLRATAARFGHGGNVRGNRPNHPEAVKACKRKTHFSPPSYSFLKGGLSNEKPCGRDRIETSCSHDLRGCGRFESHCTRRPFGGRGHS